MFGKLTLDAFTHSSLIIVFANVIMVGTGLLVIGLLTYFRKWGYLYREWFTTVDHKKIGVMYIFIALIFLLRGFIDAAMVRAQQATAGPGMEGYLEAHHFAELFTGHGTMMIFFMAMPFIVGLMNIAIPLQIGARDVSYPLLNAISLWLTAAAGALVMISLLIGQFSDRSIASNRLNFVYSQNDRCLANNLQKSWWNRCIRHFSESDGSICRA